MNTTHFFSDFWKFDLLRRTWEKIPEQNPFHDYSSMSLAGHTMTYNPTDQSLIIIGGISEDSGFSNQVLVQLKVVLFCSFDRNCLRENWLSPNSRSRKLL
jgi:hypothetical protein